MQMQIDRYRYIFKWKTNISYNFSWLHKKLLNLLYEECQNNSQESYCFQICIFFVNQINYLTSGFQLFYLQVRHGADCLIQMLSNEMNGRFQSITYFLKLKFSCLLPKCPHEAEHLDVDLTSRPFWIFLCPHSAATGTCSGSLIISLLDSCNRLENDPWTLFLPCSHNTQLLLELSF